MLRRIIALCACALMLAACTGTPGPSLKERMDARMGLTELEIVRDLGVPDGSVEAEGVRSLRWSDRRIETYPEPIPPYWVRNRPWGWPGPWGYGDRVVEYQCDVEIEFSRAGPEEPWRASSWRARGNGCR